MCFAIEKKNHIAEIPTFILVSILEEIRAKNGVMELKQGHFLNGIYVFENKVFETQHSWYRETLLTRMVFSIIFSVILWQVHFDIWQN